MMTRAVGRKSRLVREAIGALWRDEHGVTSTEYVLLLALIALSALVAFGSLSVQVQETAQDGSRALRNASGISCYRS